MEPQPASISSHAGRLDRSTRAAGVKAHQLFPINRTVGTAKLVDEFLREAVAHFAVFTLELFIALPRPMTERFNDGRVEVVVY
jgi:hypothetical protein